MCIYTIAMPLSSVFRAVSEWKALLVFERTLTECPEAYASKDESEDEHEDGGGSNDKGPDEGMLAGFIHPLRHPRQARSSPRCRRALLADESNRFPGSYSSTSVCDIGSR